MVPSGPFTTASRLVVLNRFAAAASLNPELSLALSAIRTEPCGRNSVGSFALLAWDLLLEPSSDIAALL
jgi:hypothetical protein